MATVFIPPLLRDLTRGQAKISVPGDTVRAVVDALEARFPGIGARLCAEGRLRPGLSVVVDGVVSRAGLRQPVTDASEVHFLPALSGG